MKTMNEQTNETVLDVAKELLQDFDLHGSPVQLGFLNRLRRAVESEQSRLAALQNEGQAETIKKIAPTLEMLERTASRALNHVAVANYPERQAQSMRMIEEAFEIARELLASTTPKDGQGEKGQS